MAGNASVHNNPDHLHNQAGKLVQPGTRWEDHDETELDDEGKEAAWEEAITNPEEIESLMEGADNGPE